MRLIYILLLIPFIGFRGGDDGGYTNLYPLPKVIDSLPEANLFVEVGKMCLGGAEIIALGNINDSVVKEKKDLLWERFYQNFYDTKQNDANAPQVIVDTNQVLSMALSRYRFKSDDDEEEEWWMKYYKSYPVFIVNRKDTLSLIGLQDGSVMAIQEAKDSNGAWQPVEYWVHSWCGNSYYDIKLYKNEFILVKIPIYQGIFKTELRLRVSIKGKIIYSNSFWGSVNPAQFQKPAEEMHHRSFLEEKRK